MNQELNNLVMEQVKRDKLTKWGIIACVMLYFVLTLLIPFVLGCFLRMGDGG